MCPLPLWGASHRGVNAKRMPLFSGINCQSHRAERRLRASTQRPAREIPFGAHWGPRVAKAGLAAQRWAAAGPATHVTARCPARAAVAARWRRTLAMARRIWWATGRRCSPCRKVREPGQLAWTIPPFWSALRWGCPGVPEERPAEIKQPGPGLGRPCCPRRARVPAWVCPLLRPLP